MSNAAKNFDVLAINLNVLHNYFDSAIKLFSDLYLTKFLDKFNKIILFMYESLPNCTGFVDFLHITLRIMITITL